MNKKIMATIAIACLMFVSVSIFESLPLQTSERGDIRNERNTANRGAQSDDLGNSQSYDRDNQLARPDLTENTSKVEDSSAIMDQPTTASNQNEPTALTNQTYQGQNVELPTPLPDGRIFLQANAGTEDPIPYIPTQSPKTLIGPPIVPLELDG